MATGTATAASDIDLLVVLPDTLDLDRAVALRESFTRSYVDLHCAHDRQPDLDWPGEVLYRQDLEATLAGACFAPVGADGVLRLCPPSESYRFWLSMIATGVPLTGPEAHTAAADRCAAVAATLMTTRPTDALRSLGLDPSVLRRCPRLLREFWRARSHDRSCSAPRARSQQRPLLDRDVERWRGIARERWDQWLERQTRTSDEESRRSGRVGGS